MDSVGRSPWNPARQCTATARSGERCQRQPIPGGDVCVMHGGGAPQVKQSARMRLLAGADLAIDYLVKLIEPRAACEHCGRSDADRDPVVVRACQLVLDRSGFHPTLAVQVSRPDPYEDLTVDELIEKLETLLAAAIEMRDADRARALPAAQDAVLLDDDFIVPEDGDEAAIQPDGVHVPVGTIHTPESKGD